MPAAAAAPRAAGNPWYDFVPISVFEEASISSPAAAEDGRVALSIGQRLRVFARRRPEPVDFLLREELGPARCQHHEFRAGKSSELRG